MRACEHMFFHTFLVVSSASYLLVSRRLSRLFKTHLNPFVFASFQAEKKERTKLNSETDSTIEDSALVLGQGAS